MPHEEETSPPGKGDDQSLSELESLDDGDDLANGGDGTSQQDKKATEELAKMKRKQNDEFMNKLNHIRKNPKLWASKENQFLREFCNHIECNRDEFPCSSGDRSYQDTVELGHEQQQLTKGYISAIASFQDTSFANHPILYVYSRETTHEDQSFNGFSDKQPPPTKTTHLRLVDGDGNQMTGRLSTNIADQGKQLQKGDVIRLDLYTELTHCLNGKTPKMPCVFILKFSPIKRFCSTPPVTEIHKPMACATSLPENPSLKKKKAKTTADTSDAPVTCCSLDRYCSMHGVSFIVCVCDAIPVEKLDLASVKEDCYFATDDLDVMSNSHKRNMIYWWYATNVYSICGKGKRKQLPKCLVHKIRQCHPSKEFSGFELTCG